jgi:hypothetical protein
VGIIDAEVSKDGKSARDNTSPQAQRNTAKLDEQNNRHLLPQPPRGSSLPTLLNKIASDRFVIRTATEVFQKPHC